jgi:hypothetical protein
MDPLNQWYILSKIKYNVFSDLKYKENCHKKLIYLIQKFRLVNQLRLIFMIDDREVGCFLVIHMYSVYRTFNAK